MRKFRLIILFIALFMVPNLVMASDGASDNLVNIYLFHSDTCSHCQADVDFLDLVSDRYSNVRVYKYEVHDDNNRKMYEEVALLYGVPVGSVPLTVIGDKFFLGYSDDSRLTFNRAILYYSKYGYNDRVASIVGNDKLPEFSVKKNQESLDEFTKMYFNYNVIGDIKSDDIGFSLATFLFSLFGEVNIINILVIFFLILFMFRKDCLKYKIICFFVYLFSYLVSNILFLVDRSIFSILLFGLIFGCFLYFVVRYFVDKDKKKIDNIFYIILIFLGCINNCLKFGVFNSFIDKFHNVVFVNMLSLIDTIYVYVGNLFAVILMFLLIFGILLFFRNILLKRLIKYVRN